MDFNSKKIITALMDKINLISQQEVSLTQEIEEINNTLFYKLNHFLTELNSEISISNEWNLIKYLKAFDFSVVENANNCCEKILSYLQLLSDVYNDIVVCFVNLKSFLSVEDLEEIYKFALYNKLKLLLMESSRYPKLNRENKLIIDSNFNENVVK